MRNLILTLILSIPLLLIAQEHIKPYKLSNEGLLYYDLVFEDSMLSKDLLFIKSKSWIAKNFKNGKEVDIFSDKESGTIIGKGSVRYLTTLGAFAGDQDYIGYTINIIVKPGKAKIVLDNLTFTTYGNRYLPETPTRFEEYYYKGGDPKRKARDGYNKHKQNKAEYIISIAEDWLKSMKIDNEYEKF